MIALPYFTADALHPEGAQCRGVLLIDPVTGEEIASTMTTRWQTGMVVSAVGDLVTGEVTYF